MNKKIRLLVSGVFLAWLAWRTEWVQVGKVFAHMRVELWLAAFGLYGLVQLVSAFRWQLLARPLGFQRPLWHYFGFYSIGMYFNLFLPTSVGGDVVRAWYLDGKSGTYRSAFLSVVIDRLSGLVVLLALAVIGALASPIPLPTWITTSVWSVVAAALIGLALLPRAAKHQFFRGKYEEVSTEVVRSISSVFRPSPLMLSLVVQAANVAIVWVVGLAIAAPIPGSYYWVLVPMVTLLTLLPSINGLGVREGSMVLYLSALNVPEATALSLSFLWFSVFTAAGLCGGAVYLLGRFPRPEMETKHEPVRHHSDQGRTRQPRAAA